LKYAFIAILSLFSFLSASQCGSAPDEYTLEKPEDYSEEESDAMEVIDCLLFHPSEFSKEEFDKGIAYAIIWIGGTPDYKVEVETDILTFLEEDPNLLYPYILALTMANHEFGSSPQLELETEAIHYLYKHYAAKTGYAKCKSLEKMQKKYQKGKLKDFLEELRNEK